MLLIGGSSTKLSFQSLNRDDVNSLPHVMPVAMYEGIGEDYTVLRHVFKPIFDQLFTYIKSFTATPSPSMPSPQQNTFISSSCATKVTANPTSFSLIHSTCE